MKLSIANASSRFDANYNFQPQLSHLNRSSGFGFVAVLPQCGHFMVQRFVITFLQNLYMCISGSTTVIEKLAQQNQ